MILLDSHIWYWWLTQEVNRLTPAILDCIEQADRVGVSPVSCYELALAQQRGRLELPRAAAEWFPMALDGSGVELVPMTAQVACRAVSLTPVHRDPFDRIIIATALEYSLPLISLDGNFCLYPELAGHLFDPRAVTGSP